MKYWVRVNGRPPFQGPLSQAEIFEAINAKRLSLTDCEVLQAEGQSYSALKNSTGWRNVQEIWPSATSDKQDEPARLVSCPICSRDISSAAVSCPQCGHPMSPAIPTGPTCYKCQSLATTRCQSCGAVSCIQHLRSVHFWGEARHELRCESCQESAMARKVALVILQVLIVILALFFFLR
jgi:hypothetical protein